MTILIITEKPSVARAFVKALSPKYESKPGYLVGSNNIIYTWALGHLVGLKTPAEIKEEWKYWSRETLPMIPDQSNLKSLLKVLSPDAEKQLKIIEALSQKATKIYNATDAAIEGELIFHYLEIMLNLGKKPIFRIMTSSNQPDAIQKAFKAARPNNEFIYLKQAGVTRSMSDWLIGLNATRAFTLVAHEHQIKQTITAGRVQTPTLAMVYDRHIERTKFSKMIYYTLTGHFNQNGQISYQGVLQGERITDKLLASQIAMEIQKEPGQIQEIQNVEKSTPPPLLFDLTGVAKIANQRHGYKGAETLAILQTLYEKSVITYPRTGSKYITDAEIDLMHRSFEVLSERFPQYAKDASTSYVHSKNKRIVNPEKVEDHHAILPEPVKAADLSENENNIYQIIVERFFMQFHAPYQYQQRTIMTGVKNYVFKSVYALPTNEGWKQLISSKNNSEESDKEQEVIQGLPDVMQGQVEIQKVALDEKETTPPPAYTDGTLLETMANVSLRLHDGALKEALKDKGIGTSATRTEIIAKLVDCNYLKYEKKSLVITDLGIAIIEMLRNTKINVLTSPEMTAKWEIELENIKKGKSPKNFQDSIIRFTNLIIEESLTANFKFEVPSLGLCPICQSQIKESPKTFFCEKRDDCGFFLFKNQYGKEISTTMLKQLLTKGETNTLTFKNKKKESYKAKLLLKVLGNVGKTELKF